MKTFSFYILALLIAVVVCGCQGNSSTPASSTPASSGGVDGQAAVADDVSEKDILDIALASPDHTTLVAAVQAAQIENVLVNAGPLTVFAPTNAAFEALPPGTVENLLKPENKSTLAKILTSHASPSTFTIERLKPGVKIYLATGQYVDVEVRDGDTYVNGAKILGSVDATNGIVHVVDKVFVFD